MQIGNMTSGAGGTPGYDEANRMAAFTAVSGGTEYYGYAPDNKRIYRLLPDHQSEELTLSGVRGKKLATYYIVGPGTYFTIQKGFVDFGGKLIWEGPFYGGQSAPGGAGGAVFQDRLGTNRESGARFRPYGDEVGGPNAKAIDRQKFGTHNRDGFSDLDYAEQRMYASSLGRFNTADSAPNSRITDPISWNKYSYDKGDILDIMKGVGCK